MNTALLFGTTAVLTVTGAASLPFVMHRLEDSLSGRDALPAPAERAATPVQAPAREQVPGLAQPDAA
ncbi:hypothetical protein [Lapillicoccus jejuensis]|uniref:Uncharacterized protein n=1 Tax=Lapillicoccus jejuensis TaxID=402171 RepID=A0A542E0P2_9MICO|nr:hypothetical protein [Lapillicoccus jejuensis]TQJ08902.1 hypothetical protein FB458_2002 [Lapillicoccus jejuensis]